MNEPERCRVAVASYEGVLVNQHLGMAEKLWIYELDENGYHLVAMRPTPPKGGGEERWKQLCEVVADCRALLVNGIGESPCEALNEGGVVVYEIEGLIDDALDAIRRGATLRMPKRSRKFCRRAASGFGGTGCN